MEGPRQLVAEFSLAVNAKDESDQDLMLARILQEQERAFHELVTSSVGGSYGHTSSYYGGPSSASMGDGSDVDDEELARRLQSVEDQQGLQYHMQGLGGLGFEFEDADEEVDYDRLGYEELNAIGDVVGKVSKGLQKDAIQKLPQMQVQQLRQQCACNSTSGSPCHASSAQQQQLQKAFTASSMCAICQAEYDDPEVVKLLPCGHLYHQECVDQWLRLNKTCPVCNKEVSSSQATPDAQLNAEAVHLQ